MGLQQAKEICKSIGAFQVAASLGENPSDIAPIRRIAELLARGHRTLGDKHFSDIVRYAAAVRAHTPLKLWERYSYNAQLPLTRREFILDSTYMGVLEHHTDAYVPSSLWLKASSTGIFLTMRKYPMSFHSEHIELRHLQRTSRLLHWEDEESKKTILAGLILCQVMTEKAGQEWRVSHPIALPDSRGLYFGQADLCPPTAFEPHGFWAGTKNKDGKPFFSDISSSVNTPRIALTLRTMVGASVTSTHKRPLYNAFMEILNDPVFTKETAAALSLYSSGFSHHFDDLQLRYKAITAAKARFSEIVQSGIWHDALRNGSAHIRPIPQNERADGKVRALRFG